MVELCDEAARRALFFARFESARLGAPSIETEHLLLALIREPRGHTKNLLLRLPLSDVRGALERRRSARRGTSVDTPFSAGANQVLSYAFDEADRLGYRHVSPEHLLLGILREKDSLAATVLARHGIQLENAREQVRESYATAARAHQSPIQEQLDYVISAARQVQVLLGERTTRPDVVGVQVSILMVALDSLKALLEGQ
jgi:ATP-dependent Clp protease ATP-binding subunit ClpC